VLVQGRQPSEESAAEPALVLSVVRVVDVRVCLIVHHLSPHKHCLVVLVIGILAYGPLALGATVQRSIRAIIQLQMVDDIIDRTVARRAEGTGEDWLAVIVLNMLSRGVRLLLKSVFVYVSLACGNKPG